MTDAVKTPWHLWVVGAVSLLINAFPVADFTLTNMQNEFWLSPLTAAQRSFILGAPLWSDACWALGGFGAFLGSLLLLMRSRHAVTAFIVSIIGLAGTTLYQHVLAGETTRAPRDSFAGSGKAPRTLVTTTIRPLVRCTPSQLPPACRSRPATMPLPSSHSASGAAARA